MKKFFILFLIFSFITLFFIKTTSYASAPIGNYLEFYGGYIKVNNSNSSSPSAFTIEAWVKPDNSNDYKIIFSAGAKNADPSKWGDQDYEIGITESNLQVLHRFGPNALSGVIINGITLGQWNHIAVTMTSSVTQLFINGKLMFAPSVAGSLFPIGPSVILGDNYTENSQFSHPFRGLIDEVRVSNSVRDVGSLWNSGAYNSPLTADSSTVLLWHLDENRGETVAKDASSNHLNGTLVGGDSLIYFFGVLPSPTPTPTQAPFTLAPIRWTRPTLPTLSFPFPTNPSPTSIQPPAENSPTPTTSSIRSFPRRSS